MNRKIKFDESGKIVNWHQSELSDKDWPIVGESDWPPRPQLAVDEIPVYYYNDSDGVTVTAERQVIPNVYLTADSDTIINDGIDTVTITVWILNDFLTNRNPDYSKEELLSYNSSVELDVVGSVVTKDTTDGKVKFDLTSTASAGDSIEIKSLRIDGKSIKGDTLTIEVI